MKAIVRRSYGPPETLRLEEVETPTPRDDEVLVRVHASSVNKADLDYLLGHPKVGRLGTGARRPRIQRLGLDVAGTVESVGRDVTEFKAGDSVFGDMTQYGFGGFAEYACAREAAFAPMPDGVSFEVAATIPQAGVMALQGLRGQGGMQPGDHVLVNGAGGTVGPFAVQIAKALGAAEVTGADHADKLDFVRSIGADHVIDYTTDNIAKHQGAFDYILDMAPRRSLLRVRQALRPGGRYVSIPENVRQFLKALTAGRLFSALGNKKLGTFPWKPGKPEDMQYLSELLISAKLKPAIDRTYSLEQVPEALRYQQEGRNRGKLVITM